MELILASNSPRRKELLKTAGFEFLIKQSDYEENSFCLDPIETALTFALGKAKAVFNSLLDKDKVVLGADTVVYLNGKILGKPKSIDDAVNTLKSLSGKTHTVVTGYAIITKDKTVCDYCKTLVTFNNLSEETIKKYIDSGLYKGKAGSYGIQDGFNLVEKHEGSLSNVIGLPIEKVAPILKEFING